MKTSFSPPIVILSAALSAEPKDPCILSDAPPPPPVRNRNSRYPKLFTLFTTLLLTLTTLPAHAHIGSKDIFEQLTAGPYKFFVTIRPPDVVPGVATVEIRTLGPQIRTLEVTPIPLTGEASKHPPTPDKLERSPDDSNFFTGSLWLMAPGSWQVRLRAEGAAGPASVSVPVPAMALAVMRMQRPLGLVLATLGLVLILGMAGIVYAAVREARLAPGTAPTPSRQRRALVAGAFTLVLLLALTWAGDKWWNVDAADFANGLYRPLPIQAQLRGNTLLLHLGSTTPDEHHQTRLNDDLLPDHGHLMHLYAIRWPQMDAAFHLHPTRVAAGELSMTLPAMPAGTYRLYGDIVHRTGFPETLTTTLTVPPGFSNAALGSEDAQATPPPLSAGMLGTRYKLPDGYTMIWDRPGNLTAHTAELFRFTLLDPHGDPANDMQPYLGMAGHAAFVKTDGTVFAHTHPEGSAAMAALMLANQPSEAGPSDLPSDNMPGMNAAPTSARGFDPMDPIVEFPYGFPSPGRYRIFIQMKHGTTVETGVFDANVQ